MTHFKHRQDVIRASTSCRIMVAITLQSSTENVKGNRISNVELIILSDLDIF